VAIWAMNVVLAFLLGLLVAERITGRRVLVSVSSSRMVYPRVDDKTPRGRSFVVEAWVGGARP